jgi:haloacetate dehalogenase
MSESETMFEGFQLSMIDTGEAVLRVRHGGSGAPLLLLHGHPQTHVCWHKIAPYLAQHFTVVAADLRGYGDSSKPATTPDHEPYSKPAMARDMVCLMQRLGFEQFYVAGHDRGGRCAYRMALDHPERVRKLAVLDILPTGEHFRRANKDFALKWWHWFFLAQPADLPERLIGADPDYYYLHRQGKGIPAYYTPEALADYQRCWRNPATIHAFCEDYRAGATIDLALDEADYGRKKIICPLLALWGGRDDLPGLYGDILAIWRAWADDVRGQAIDSRHHLPEEAPDETFQALYQFFAEA